MLDDVYQQLLELHRLSAALQYPGSDDFALEQWEATHNAMENIIEDIEKALPDFEVKIADIAVTDFNVNEAIMRYVLAPRLERDNE